MRVFTAEGWILCLSLIRILIYRMVAMAAKYIEIREDPGIGNVLFYRKTRPSRAKALTFRSDGAFDR